MRNILEIDAEENSYDVIVSVAAFHHINMQLLLPKINKILKPEGLLIVLDLYEDKGAYEKIMSLFSVFYSRWLRAFNNLSRSENRSAAIIWTKHAQTDEYLRYKDLKKVYNNYFNNIILKRKLLWRYLLVCQKRNND